MVALRDALRPTVAVVDELRGIARALSTTGAAAAPPPPRAVSPATVARLTRDAIKAFTGVGFGFGLPSAAACFFCSFFSGACSLVRACFSGFAAVTSTRWNVTALAERPSSSMLPPSST